MAVMYNIKRRETSFHLSECFTMHLTVRLIFLIWSLSRLTQASLSDPYSSCIAGKACQAKFANGACDQDCSSSACLRDGFDCLKDKGTCTAGYIQYCRDHYDNSHCEQGCNNAPCGWDGSDCYRSQYPIWAKGSLILHTRIPFQRGHFQNSSLLWAVSTVIQTSVKFRGMAPFHLSNDLLSIDTRQLADLYAQTSSYESDGSVLFLQLDNRPCSRFPSTCFQYAVEAAHFLITVMAQNRILFPMIPEIKESVISIRGVDEEIGAREEVKLPKEERNASPTWMWPVVGVATGLAVAVAVIIVVLFLWLKRRRHRRDGGEHVRHRSTVTDGNNVSKAWSRRSDQQEKRGRSGRDKDILKKKKKGKDSGKRRKEPLGEDSIRMRPLRKELDIGSDTDITQSSMEDINKTICDHRSPDHKHFQVNHHQPRMLAPPRGWERNPVPIPPRPPRNTAPVQWCGPDGSVVLIRAVRSGLDRVVLELLRAGVPVNNTDHTGRSALHWACSVNHLPLTRTLIRYGAALDLQDHKGETPLFLSALHGCYDTARFLVLNGANQGLNDCKGRRPLDVAREGLHHQVLELLLAHRVQRGPVPLDPATEVLWDDRTYVYSPWVASPQCLPGRSASFSGVIGHRGMSTPPPDDWQMGRAQCASPQNWRPALNQSATALVSPRIHQSRPISTLQEVTSEAEDEERELTQEIIRAATPHFLSPQPAPRQRSFSCTQHALNRRNSGNQSELSAATPAEKAANEHVEIVIVSQPKEASQQSESKTIGTVPTSAATEPTRENSRNYNSKIQNERINNEPSISIQTTM